MQHARVLLLVLATGCFVATVTSLQEENQPVEEPYEFAEFDMDVEVLISMNVDPPQMKTSGVMNVHVHAIDDS